MSVVTNQQNSVLYTFYLPILYGYEKCVPFTLEPISEHLLMWEVCGRLLLGVNVECFYNINIKLLVISYWTYPWIIQKAFFFENKAYCNFGPTFSLFTSKSTLLNFLWTLSLESFYNLLSNSNSDFCKEMVQIVNLVETQTVLKHYCIKLYQLLSNTY